MMLKILYNLNNKNQLPSADNGFVDRDISTLGEVHYKSEFANRQYVIH